MDMNNIDYQMVNAVSREANHTPHVFIDITGSLVAGTLLSQIVYWFSPAPNGEPKIRIYKDGHGWLAKGRTDWKDEIRISEYEYDSAIKTLKGLGLVETRLFKYDGSPKTHIRLIGDALNGKIQEWQWKKREIAEEKQAQMMKKMAVLEGGSGKLILDDIQNRFEELSEIEFGCNPKSLTEPTYRDYISTSKEVDCLKPYKTGFRQDIEESVSLWNNLSEIGLKPISRLNADSTRYKCLKARLQQYGIEGYRKAIDEIKRSDFLQGRHTGRPWEITFDWFVKPNNFPKVLDGNYRNDEGRKTMTQEDVRKARIEEGLRRFIEGE